MKRLGAAILLTILLFNLAGYRLAAHLMEQRLDAQLEARLDDHQYNETQLIEVKIALHMPYQSGGAAYERYDGEIKMDGITYKYVARKLSGDTLYLKCIPHTSGMHLEAAKNDFLKNNSDLVQNNSSKKQDGSKQAGWKKNSGDWEQQVPLLQTECLIPQKIMSFPIAENISSSPHTSPEQPPDLFMV